MKYYNEKALSPILKILVSKIEAKDFVIDKTGVKTVELIGAYIPLNPDQPYLDFGVKKSNKDYIDREISWYDSQSLNVNDIPGGADKIPTIWKIISDRKGKINSNYGYLIFNKKNYNQFESVFNELKENKESRRAIMIYNRPSIWKEYNKNGMSDFICCISNQFLIRHNKLYSLVNFRSNDLVYGFMNDFAWKCYVYKLLFKKLKEIYPELGVGELIWNAGSLHVYEKHFELVRKMYEFFIETIDNGCEDQTEY